MSSLIDLREHFGIWKRCGNTRFFQKESPSSKIYLNPLDGLLASAHGARLPSGEVRYTFVVRIASRATVGDIQKVFDTNYPWIQRAVKEFFELRALGWANDAIKEYTGQEPLPGDRDMGNFIKLYEAGGERYLKEGSRDYQQFVWEGGVLKDRGDRPFLEEALQAIYITISSIPITIKDYGRDLSEADVQEALADRGILEC